MFRVLSKYLQDFGLDKDLAGPLSSILILVGIFILSVSAYKLTKRILLRVLRTLILYTSFHWDKKLLEQKFFDRLAHFVPALIIYFLVPLAFPPRSDLIDFLDRLSSSYIILLTLFVIDALINAALAIYNESALARQNPLRSYAQILKIFIYLIGSILIIATLMNRSALGFLSGLGAMTAIIALVFKDTILGFVASIQLSANDMLSKGDSIEMPQYGADGEVLEITLNTVKIQNWDKTITTIPTYALVSHSFKNWRGMTDAGARRIKRPFLIDIKSIRFCTNEELDRYEKIIYLKDYVQQKRSSLQAYNEAHIMTDETTLNENRLTNIGVFRVYVQNYLQHHPKVRHDMSLIVRHLPPTEKGLPIEIYVFSRELEWSSYEDIQADILDHILAILPEFGLRVFQGPTGADFANLLQASSAEKADGIKLQDEAE